MRIAKLDPEDATARARILEAAIEQFGEVGFERATIRGIAEVAGVSSGLLRHHFGSKQELQAACDRRVTALLHAMNADAVEFLQTGQYTPAHLPEPYGAYLARSLTAGGSAAIFDDMAAITEQWIARVETTQPGGSATSAHDRAVVSTAQALAASVLHSHVSRGLGIDIRTPEGERQLRRVLVDLYAVPLVTAEEAQQIRAALDASGTSGRDPLDTADHVRDKQMTGDVHE